MIRIPLPTPILGHNGLVYKEVALREPTFRQYLEHGEVIEHIVYPNGMRIATVNNATVERYLQCCIVEPKDPLLLEQCGIAVAKEVRDAIINFIHGEPSAAPASPTSAPTSSGASAPAASPSAT